MANHLSYSQLNVFKECGRLWQAKYRLGLKEPPTDDLVFGSAVHKLFEQVVMGAAEEPANLWDAAWADYGASKNVVWNRSPEECWDTGRRIALSGQVMDLVRTVRPKISEATREPMVERYFRWRPDRWAPEVVGYIDVVAEDGVPVDFKTASRMWTPARAAAEAQPGFYLSALAAEGEPVPGLRFRHLVVTKGAFPEARLFETEWTEAQVAATADWVREAWGLMSRGELRANPRSWLCTAACPAMGLCPEGRGRWFGPGAAAPEGEAA